MSLGRREAAIELLGEGSAELCISCVDLDGGGEAGKSGDGLESHRFLCGLFERFLKIINFLTMDPRLPL